MSETNKRILVIDDDREIWKAYSMVLEPPPLENNPEKKQMDQLLGGYAGEQRKVRQSFLVEYADQGRDGFAEAEKSLAEQQPFAVAFIDVRMPPGWDGMKTATSIRQLDKNIEIVIVTAYSDRSCEEIINQVGSPDKLLFIRKPFDSEELRQLAVSLTEKWTIARHEEAQRIELQEKIIELTEMQHQQQALQKKLVQAQKMEAIGLMAGGVAHDLNNILSGLVSYPELMLMKLPSDSELSRYVEAMREAGLRASAVVADMLTVARGVAMVREPHDINELVLEHLDSPEGRDMKSRYPQISFTTIFAEKNAVISCSTVHVKKCLMNLLTNAAEAVEGEGSVVVTTDIMAGDQKISDGCRVILQVSDTGPGIAADDLERIFEPFFSKKELGRSGTGLGLAVVWNCVQNHDGTIDVESSDQGTVFTITFPLSNHSASLKPECVSIETLKGAGTILVVDDEEQQRDIAGTILSQLGYTVEVVSSGQAAVDYLQTRGVDLLLLDMVMDPGMNGYQTYEKIVGIHPDQKALLVSGFTESSDVQRAMALGAGGFVGKPYTMEELGTGVAAILEG